MTPLDVDELDKILQDLANTVFRHGQATNTNIPFHHGEPVKEAKLALLTYIKEEVIGGDDEITELDHIDVEEWKFTRNELRESQRNRLEQS